MKHLQFRYRWTCPYCRLNQVAYVRAEIYETEHDMHEALPGNDVVYCDIEQGGCDKRVALIIKADIIATAFKIEDN